VRKIAEAATAGEVDEFRYSWYKGFRWAISRLQYSQIRQLEPCEELDELLAVCLRKNDQIGSFETRKNSRPLSM
jgi:hypothetical protein